jgi:diguanylate cyclase (GGDEF)-like protein/PAS domain S-box-containing protein
VNARVAAVREGAWVVVTRWPVVGASRAGGLDDPWYRAMFETNPVGQALADGDGLVVAANPAYCALVGRGLAELVGRSSREFTHPDDLAQHAAVGAMMAAVEVGEAAVQLEKRYLRPDGTVRWAWVALAYVAGPGGERWTLATVHDITDRRRGEDLLRIEASTDALTGLWNRRGWRSEMSQLLLRREPGQPVTIAMLDMDHLKAYNDSRGHGAGDALLQEFGARARAALRNGDVLARWGGEEFALALPGCTSGDAAVVLGLLARVVPDGQCFSAGYTTMRAGESVADAGDRADILLYTAKRQGRDRAVTDDDTP